VIIVGANYNLSGGKVIVLLRFEKTLAFLDTFGYYYYIEARKTYWRELHDYHRPT